MEDRTYLPRSLSKKELRNRLYEKGIPSKEGLPSVRKPSLGLPSRTAGLQPKNSSAAQAKIRANVLGQQDALRLAGASPAVLDPPRAQPNGSEMPDSLRQYAKKRSLMFFGSIDDVQQQENDPLYEDDEAMTYRDGAQSHRLTGEAAKAQQVVMSSLNSNVRASIATKKNLQSLNSHSTALPPMMAGSKSALGAVGSGNELRLKVPKHSNQDSSANWAVNVNEQLSTFREHQAAKFLPQVSKSHSQMPKLTASISQANNIAQVNHPQFSTMNCDPYQRDGAKGFGLTHAQSQAQMPTKQTNMHKSFSRPVSSITGVKLMTALGPGSHMHKQRLVEPHASGSTIGDKKPAFDHSEAFKQGRQTTKQLRVKIMQDRKQSAANDAARPGSKQSFTQKIRAQAQGTRNPGGLQSARVQSKNDMAEGQVPNTEELLRKHYFMAKATQKTSYTTLQREQSPQKHMLKANEGELQRADMSQPAGLQKLREDNIENLQGQAAALMRLNAVWGLEEKGPTIDILRAQVNEELADQGGVVFDVLEGKKQVGPGQEEMSELDMMIHLFNTQPEDTGYFIYLVPGPSGDPYDLVPLIDYKQTKKKDGKDYLVKLDKFRGERPSKNLHAEKFYTLSKKGFTMYVNEEPMEYISLQDWLVDRHYYRQISNKAFFKNFRKWKIIRMWRRNILQNKREEIKLQLTEKLFAIDDVFGPILRMHRASCKDMENLRIIEMKQGGFQASTLEDFQHKQAIQRDVVTQCIKQKSHECRDMFKKGINDVLDRLRQSINEPEDDDPSSKPEFTQKPSDASQPKQIVNTNPTLEALGFSHSLKYGPRSKLRKACTRFLRFSYLLDFLATEALTNIYLFSVNETIDRLEGLTAIPVEYQFKSSKAPYESNVSERPATGNKKDKGENRIRSFAQEQPFFQVTGIFMESQIPQRNKFKEMIDEFRPPPIGVSDINDFNPLVHLELEPNDPKGDSESEKINYPDEEPENNSMMYKQEGEFVRDLDKLWLHVNPSGQKFSTFLNECMLDGMECLRVFERWSRHPDLDKYEAVLETWDDRVVTEWEAPDQMYLNCGEWLEDNKLYASHQTKITDQIKQAFQQVHRFFESYQPFLIEFWQNKRIDFEILKSDDLKNPAEVIEALLHRFATQKEKYEDLLPEHKDVGMIRVETGAIKKTLTEDKFYSPKQYLHKMREVLPSTIKHRIELKKAWLQEQIKTIKTKPQKVHQYVAQIKSLDYIDANYQDVKEYIELNSRIFGLCVEYELIGKEDKARRFIDEAYSQCYKLQEEVSEARENADRNKEEMKIKIQKKIPKLHQRNEIFLREIEKPQYLDIESDIEITLADIAQFDLECDELVSKRESIQEYQRTLDMGAISQFNDVEEAKRKHIYRAKLWRALNDWTNMIRSWETAAFDDIDVEKISATSDKFSKTAIQCERNLDPTSTAVMRLKKLVFDFKETMPIVKALGCEFLQPIHWAEIRQLLKIPEDFALEEKQWTLGELMDYNVAEKQEDVELIATTATHEFKLNAAMKQIQETWQVTEFSVIPHGNGKDCYKLEEIDKVVNLLDESLSQTSDIMGSRFVKRLQVEVQRLHETLILISETIDQWKMCQRQWLYLENIFQSKDIRTQRPKDFIEFESVNKSWGKLMKKVILKRNVRLNCTAGRLKEFIKFNEQMDRIQKNLDAYLEEKRTQFPRFYFISSDELLQMLAHQQDISQVERHLNKLFGNIQRLQISEETDPPEIVAMISSEKEEVEFQKNKLVKVRNGVEVWLELLKVEMINTLTRKVKDALTDSGRETTDRDEWVMRHCGQAIAVVAMVNWTEQTEAAIAEMEDDPFAENPVISHLKEMQSQLNSLVALIRKTDINPIKRMILTALITQEVHNRTIIENLIDKEVESTTDFTWQQCLRYYFEGEVVQTRQVNANIWYGYEYMGATSRLVVTPLTDRCWLTITGAMHIKLGASPKGPAGTGKTESTKDLAKGLGIYCIVFNCSEQIEYKFMGRILSGLVQSGSWSCLDEFNRINVEVLSVIAQYLLDIRQAKLAEKEKFPFNEHPEMPLNPNCGVFITMNPGYAGRAELPDNLKVLFRPVAMMIPAYGLVAEVMLFSEGFADAKRLSVKMVQLYKLSSEQLSQQDHYDFGMRAVKSVLAMAGNLKRANPTLEEDVVLIRAMRDSNVPKFLAEDLPLFRALIQDLFPDVLIPPMEFLELEEQIEQSVKSLNLDDETEDVLPRFKLKVLQLFETFNVRFGVMVVGPAGGGKTQCFQVLQHALTELRKQGAEDERFQDVKTKTLNPKSISMGELYGEENLDTKEWTDGLASRIIRKFAGEDGERKCWTVFDGPVDALWIENMNTVLDDNMTLCLANGERIKLRNQMRMLFEVQDLAQAAPSTVSRCGMVYMTPGDLGWRPYKTQWIKKFLSKHFPQTVVNELNELFELYIDEAFTRMAPHRDHQAMPCYDMQIVQNLCCFLEAFFTKAPGLNLNTKKEVWVRYLNAYFAYSFFWAFGGHFKSSASRFLDNMMRDFFAKNQIDGTDTVYEYFLELKECKFVHWKHLLGEFTYPTRPTPFFQLVVPTIETLRSAHILGLMTQVSKPIFVTGGTGTGKSMIIQNFINENKEKLQLLPIVLNFSAQTDSNSTQANIESKLVKKRKKFYGAQGNKKCVIFVDDVNMPAVEQYGAQPPIELLRQLVDQHGFYQRPSFQWMNIENFTLVCAAAPPDGGRSILTPRFMRHFQVMNIPDATEETLTHIFKGILDGFLFQEQFQDNIRKQAEVVVSATIELYANITKSLLPIPSKFHYTFNMRDVAKVFQGILMSDKNQIVQSDDFGRLWMHECTRVFADRLCAQEDKQEFQKQVCELLTIKFKVKWGKPEECFGPDKDTLFSSILRLEEKKEYQIVADRTKLLAVLDDKLIDYNFSSSNKMDLVFFEDAIQHILRILRILMQPRGNAMLIGLSGSGKQSLTRFAASILEHDSFQVKLSKNFKPADFRETLKEKMLIAGTTQKSTTFILNDTQIMHECFLEDVNNILNTGEITNLYTKEDLDQMQDSGLNQILSQKKIPINKDSIYQEFVEQLRDSFHIILCMSPVGEQLRNRCRMFPSLVNCCTLDWFDSWPEAALLSVADQFLQRLPEEQVSIEERASLSELFPIVHKSVEEQANRFFLELRRKTYVTPKSYLDGVQLYLKSLNEVQTKHERISGVLRSGIEKLKSTYAQIEELQAILTELKPQLEEQNKHAQFQAEAIKKNTEEVTLKAMEAEQEEAQVKQEASAIELLKQEAERELSNAIPALEQAQKAVDSLSKDDITELKKTANPNKGTEIALECTLLYLGFSKPDWPLAQKELSKIDFLNRVKNYDKENIPDKILKKVKKIVQDRKNFKISDIAKSSKAAGGLANWCKAISVYAETLTVVRPRQENVRVQTEKFNEMMKEVREKQAVVQGIRENLKKMEEELKETEGNIKQLSEKEDLCEKRFMNAEKLIELLGEEGKRWEEQLKAMDEEKVYFTGNVMLAAASLSYLGPFTGKYRDELIKQWIKQCKKRGIKIVPNYSLVNTLGDQIKIRDWSMNGLPSDTVSVDNAILASKTTRWPLMIDPQTQANSWIKKMYKYTGDKDEASNFFGDKLVIIKANAAQEDDKELASSKGFKQLSSQKKLELAIMAGDTVLMEECGENIDPGLDSVLSKAYYPDEGVMKLNFGDKPLIYDTNFRLLLTTKLHNPHFLPETCIKLTVINFTVTFDGLEDQLLVDVINNREPEIEKRRDKLVVEIATSKNQLARLQEQILFELAESNAETILDNVKLIETLQIAKKESTAVAASLQEAVQVEETINTTRNRYRNVAERGSILYFSIVEMSQVDPMYQNSLSYVKRLFNEAILQTRKVAVDESAPAMQREAVHQQNINSLIQAITKQLFEKICIGLFEAHKIIYAFIICTSIQRKAGLIDETLWSFLLRGPGIFDKTDMPQKPQSLSFVSDSAWDLIYCLTRNALGADKASSRGEGVSHNDLDEVSNAQSQEDKRGTPKGKVPKSAGDKVPKSPGSVQEAQEEQSKVNPFFDFCNFVTENAQAFEAYVLKDDTNFAFYSSMPCGLSRTLTPFERLLVIKIFKPEKIMFGVERYLEEELGSEYAHSPISSMPSLFSAADSATPIIFVLSQGVDPTWQVEQYAKRCKYDDKLEIMSLGQGQEARAAHAIERGSKEGKWVLLQNCHLFKSWMPQLEGICSGLIDNQSELDDRFRLILTSMPVDFFPSSIVQNGLKMTTEPPRGIKSNLQRSYQSIVTQDTYDEILSSVDPGAKSSIVASDKEEVLSNKSGINQRSQDNSGYVSASHSAKARVKASEDQSISPVSDIAGMREKQLAYRNLLYSLCFFHAVIQERRKYGPLGWNIFYEFNDADLRTSITMIKNFLLENDEIPWEAMKFMTGHINYGGNVTDDFDRTLLMVFLNIFQNEEVVERPGYEFSKSGIYICPVHEKASEVRDHIKNLPNQDDPEIFGMNNNANIAYLQSESDKILQTVLSVQPRSQAGGQSNDGENPIIELINKLQDQIPEPIDNAFAKDIMKLNNQGLLHCLTTVLQQEVQRYNRLLHRIKTSLEQLHDAVLGVVLSSPTLDAMHTCLLDNQVPENWREMAYPSLKPLASWISDLVQRIDFMREWSKAGHPDSYWLAGFFFPHGFITGVLQTYARKHNKPIDLLQFEFEVLEHQDAGSVKSGPADGVYVYGLFLESAKWNAEQHILVEAEPGEMHSQMPVIHFNPVYKPPVKVKDLASPTKVKVMDEPEDPEEVYKCPVYKTSARAGTLNTTGRSDNYILTIDIPCGVVETEEQRIKKTYGTEFDDENEAGQVVPFASADFWTLRGTALLCMLNA